MKKILLGASIAVSILLGNGLARLMFTQIEAKGDETITACAFLAWLMLYLIYRVAERPIKEAIAVRLAVRAQKARDKQFIANYESLRRDFLEGRGVTC